jgi:hypothetical protein
MQGAQPLANGGKLDELEKLVDHALEMLGECPTCIVKSNDRSS